MVLAAGVGELGLKEHLLAPHDSAGDCSLHRGADSGLEVVAPLVRRVDAPEAGFESEAGQPLGLLLLPRCTVEEPGADDRGGLSRGGSSHGITRAAHTSSRSNGRATRAYSAGIRKTLMRRRENSPPTMTRANGRCVSDPIPVDNAAGRRPNAATRPVIMMGRRRRIAASRVASMMPIPFLRSSFA